jgi:hypothetical protein
VWGKTKITTNETGGEINENAWKERAHRKTEQEERKRERKELKYLYFFYEIKIYGVS